VVGKYGFIVLFIKDLPDTATSVDTKQLFLKLIRPRWRTLLFGHSGVCSCDILRISRQGNDHVEFHAIVKVQPAKLALHAIRELNGTLLHGHCIKLHRYTHRSPMRDRRSSETGAQDHHGVRDAERRVTDRRRDHLQFDLVKRGGQPLLATLQRMLQPIHSI